MGNNKTGINIKMFNIQYYFLSLLWQSLFVYKTIYSYSYNICVYLYNAEQYGYIERQRETECVFSLSQQICVGLILLPFCFYGRKTIPQGFSVSVGNEKKEHQGLSNTTYML